MKPSTFREPFKALCNVPYSLGHPDDGTVVEGGVLRKGQVIWTEKNEVPLRSEAAFLEGVGIISLNPHWLVPAKFIKDSE